MPQVRISSTIANEYSVRCVWEHDEWKGFPGEAGTHAVDFATARQMLADAEFQADAKEGPEHDIGTRSAYRALRDQLREVFED